MCGPTPWKKKITFILPARSWSRGGTWPRSLERRFTDPRPKTHTSLRRSFVTSAAQCKTIAALFFRTCRAARFVRGCSVIRFRPYAVHPGGVVARLIRRGTAVLGSSWSHGFSDLISRYLRTASAEFLMHGNVHDRGLDACVTQRGIHLVGARDHHLTPA